MHILALLKVQAVEITVIEHKVAAYKIWLVITEIFMVIMKGDRTTHLLSLH